MKLFFTSVVFILFCGFLRADAMKRRTTLAPGSRPTKRPLHMDQSWYTCDFENGYCGWRNDSTAEFQWSRRANETPTEKTGPRSDHTETGVRGIGYYLYIETSIPSENGDRARLISPELFEEGVFCLKFWHNMHGDDVRDLNVYIKGRKSRKLTRLLHLSGPWSVVPNIPNKEDEDNDWWNQEYLEFTVREPVNIIFEGVRGEDERGDIAIDDIELRKGRCPQQSVDCDFENNTCGWTQMAGDEFNWLPNRGNTQSKNTGPSHDHTLQNPSGRYLYIETSYPRDEGDKARLISPKISCDEAAIPVFNFWYNMNGIYMGSLKIYVTSFRQRLGNPVWEKTGNQGEKWFLGQVVISQALASNGFYIIIEGERKDYQGDAGIDDVSLTGCRKDEKGFGKLSSLTTPSTTPHAKAHKNLDWLE